MLKYRSANITRSAAVIMKSHNGVPLTRIASIHETVRNDQEPMTEKKMTAKAMIFSILSLKNRSM